MDPHDSDTAVYRLICSTNGQEWTFQVWKICAAPIRFGIHPACPVVVHSQCDEFICCPCHSIQKTINPLPVSLLNENGRLTSINELKVPFDPVGSIGIDLVFCTDHNVIGMLHLKFAFYRLEDCHDPDRNLDKSTLHYFPIET